MATTGRISDYDDELLVEPADDDLIDVSVLVSTSPDVWLSTKIRYALIKASGSSIPADIVPTGTGTSLQASELKVGDIAGDGTYIGHKDFFTDTAYAFYLDKSNGKTWINGTGEIVFTVDGGNRIMDLTDQVVSLARGEDTKRVEVGSSVTSTGAKMQIKGETDDDTKSALDITNESQDILFKVRNDGEVFLSNGTGINEFSIDGTLAGDSDDAVPTEKAVKTYVDAQSVGGWLGSETRIKIAPWDVVSYNDKDGVSIQNNGGVVNDAAAKITTMVTGVFIPTGYRATAFMINASANIAVELFESQIDDDTQVSKGSGNANTEVNITNVDSTTTNYLSIIIVEAGNDIYGGYITIEKI